MTTRVPSGAEKRKSRIRAALAAKTSRRAPVRARSLVMNPRQRGNSRGGAIISEFRSLAARVVEKELTHDFPPVEGVVEATAERSTHAGKAVPEQRAIAEK